MFTMFSTMFNTILPLLFGSSTTPVFASGIVKYSADELVRILLDKQRHNGFVSQQQPLRIQESKVFLVDTSELGVPEDIKADDLGSWKNDGQHSRWAKVKQVNGSVRLVEFCSGKPRNDPSSYCLHRHYYVHHSNNQFKRKIVWLSGMTELPVGIVYVTNL